MDSLLLLTGTPLQNNVQELWSLLRLIQVRVVRTRACVG
jgi:SNF2 family DNA or RNA helicase